MQTEFPSTEFLFVFSFTYCRLRVYKTDEAFARAVLEANRVEFCTPEESENWQEIDTRILLDLVSRAIKKKVPDSLPRVHEVAKQVNKALGIE